MAKTLSIDDMRQLANEKGGWCLSEEYVNIVSTIKFHTLEIYSKACSERNS